MTPSRTILSLASGALVLAGAIAPASSPAAASAASAPTTCQGKAVTITGTPGHRVVEGTSGDDVITSNGAIGVDAAGGNDTICITAPKGKIPKAGKFDAESGDDSVTVDYTEPYANQRVFLARGSDTFVGGPGPDIVTYEGESFPGQGHQPGDVDHVETKGGNDYVELAVYFSTDVIDDVVHLGTGDDRIFVDGPVTMAPDAEIVGGSGHDSIVADRYVNDDPVNELGAPGGPLVVDAATGAVEDGAPVLHWASMENFNFSGSTSLDFTGTDGDDGLGFYNIETVTGSLGDGDDTVAVSDLVFGFGENKTKVDVDVDLGAGRDTLDARGMDADEGFTTVDLAAGTLKYGSHGHTEGTASVTGADDAYAQAREVSVRGTSRSNTITVTCGSKSTEVLALGGDDVVRTTLPDQFSEDTKCRQGVELKGGSGDDTLFGERGPDRLTGGAGRDEAHGREGKDTCSAEKKFSC